MFAMFSRILKLSGRYKGRIQGAFVCAFLESILSKMPIVLAFVVLSRFAADTLTSQTCLYIGLGIATAVLVQMLVHYLSDSLQSAAGYLMFADKRMELGSHLRKLPMGYFTSGNIGKISSVLSTDIPMISEEQQKHQAAEQKDFEMNMDTSGLAVAGHIGTWHTIDHMEVDGHTFWLMEHDTYGDEAACIIVDDHGKLSLSNVYDGFDEHTVDLLRQEVTPVDRMPDDSISVDEMKKYGYGWGGMLPMREEAAAEVMKSCTVYRLYGDDSEGMVMDANDLKDHADRGGIFGVEKVEWKAALERQNPLKAAEMSTEDDYGMIDGIINNGPKEKEDKSSEKGGKSSIMDRLKAAKSEPHQDKPTPHKERKNDREL